MLRDQIARLNLVAEGGESEQLGTHEDHYDESKFHHSLSFVSQTLMAASYLQV